jgi:sRNA-binding protein
MNDSFEKANQEAAAFQKIWTESVSKTMLAAFKFTPDSMPPDMMRQIRSGILQSLGESWNEFMRSPQFLEGMRQWTENAISFRKMSNEFLGRIRNDLQAPSRTDIDTVMLSVRHMEKRLLDRIDELSAQIAAQQNASGGLASASVRRKRASRKSNQPKSTD